VADAWAEEPLALARVATEAVQPSAPLPTQVSWTWASDWPCPAPTRSVPEHTPAPPDAVQSASAPAVAESKLAVPRRRVVQSVPWQVPPTSTLWSTAIPLVPARHPVVEAQWEPATAWLVRGAAVGWARADPEASAAARRAAVIVAGSSVAMVRLLAVAGQPPVSLAQVASASAAVMPSRPEPACPAVAAAEPRVAAAA
jgi:hypothetical protein